MTEQLGQVFDNSGERYYFLRIRYFGSMFQGSKEVGQFSCRKTERELRLCASPIVEGARQLAHGFSPGCASGFLFRFRHLSQERGSESGGESDVIVTLRFC